MQPEFFTIRRPGPGRLATMARPRGGPRLGADLAGLAGAGISVLVSMLTDAEMAELGLAREPAAATGAGLEFLRLPTPDMTVPGEQATLAMAGLLRARLTAGAGVVVHCLAGVGRSSTLAAAVLVLEGVAPAAAWELITAARGVPVPDTPAQRAFIDRLPASPAPSSSSPAG
jgi:protein-tyrosine phosphatase